MPYGFFDWLQGLDFDSIGYGVVGLFVVTWAVSVVVRKKPRNRSDRQVVDPQGGVLDSEPPGEHRLELAADGVAALSVSTVTPCEPWVVVVAHVPDRSSARTR